MTIAAVAMLAGAIGAPNEMLAEGKTAMRELTPGAVQSRPIPIEGELPLSPARPNGAIRSP